MAPTSKRARRSAGPAAPHANGHTADDNDSNDGEDDKPLPPVQKDVTRFKIRHPTWEKTRKRKRQSLPNLNDCKKEVPPGFPPEQPSIFKVAPYKEWTSMVRYKRFTSKAPFNVVWSTSIRREHQD